MMRKNPLAAKTEQHKLMNESLTKRLLAEWQVSGGNCESAEHSHVPCPLASPSSPSLFVRLLHSLLEVRATMNLPACPWNDCWMCESCWGAPYNRKCFDSQVVDHVHVAAQRRRTKTKARVFVTWWHLTTKSQFSHFQSLCRRTDDLQSVAAKQDLMMLSEFTRRDPSRSGSALLREKNKAIKTHEKIRKPHQINYTTHVTQRNGRTP